jgi:hypothetical protein
MLGFLVFIASVIGCRKRGKAKHKTGLGAAALDSKQPMMSHILLQKLRPAWSQGCQVWGKYDVLTRWNLAL